jgi:UDP-N-acetylmuramate dehydrogenase
MPTFAATDGKSKLSAGWLIERAGFAKGTVRGNVGISRKHALALVNRGGTTTELLALANEVIVGVRNAFGVTLEPEPIIVGV